MGHLRTALPKSITLGIDSRFLGSVFMKNLLIGSWKSVDSGIPGYVPGKEWLHFNENGENLWEVSHPEYAAGLKKIWFYIHPKKPNVFDFIARVKPPSINSHVSWEVVITFVNDDKFSLIHHQNLATLFVRVERAEKESAERSGSGVWGKCEIQKQYSWGLKKGSNFAHCPYEIRSAEGPESVRFGMGAGVELV
jgi:hypothetical protein